MITVPDEYSKIPPQQQHFLHIDESSAHLANYDGTTVAFDSYSTAEERVRWSPLVKSVSQLNDTSNHFLADWNIRVSGKLSAILGPENIEMYTTVYRKRDARPMKPVATHGSVTTEFDEEIMELKRHCASLDAVRPSKQQRHISTAEALLSMNQTPSTFAEALKSNPTSAEPFSKQSSRHEASTTPIQANNDPCADEVSAAVSALCAFGRLM